MLSQEANELVTRTGPGTPGGEFMRRYWQPVALSEELPTDGAPIAVRLLGEDLVLFRERAGAPGLLGLHCSHRGADLSYGRVEDGGLRCIYHGWLYDADGRCLEQPGEPTGSTFHERIRQRAYPCQEAAGVIFAYLGPGEPPLIPDYPFLNVPLDHVYATKTYSECNYLQGNEGNLDFAHVSFLHYCFEPLMLSDPSEFLLAELPLDHDADAAASILSSRGRAPGIETVEVQEIPSGLRIGILRKLAGDKQYLRVLSFVFPNAASTPGGWFNCHAPIDDESHWRYSIHFDFDRPLARDTRWHERIEQNYRPQTNRANRYRQDRSLMRSESYSGIPMRQHQAQDLCVTEGMGAIQDRTQEHLTQQDIPLVLVRNMLLTAIRQVQEGADPPVVARDVASRSLSDVTSVYGKILDGTSWRDYCDQLAAQGRGWSPSAIGSRARSA